MYVGVPEDEFLLTPQLPPLGAQLCDTQCYALAYRAAFAGLGHVSPNPLVGCVITDAQGHLLAVGAHRRYGAMHAEADAVAQAQARGGVDCLRGARLFVTLQPCTHHGKTTPCSTLLVQHGLREVHFGAADPNPQVSGWDELVQAGITCHKYEHRDLQWLDEAYFFHAAGGKELASGKKSCKRSERQRPFVAVKIAAGLDSSFAAQQELGSGKESGEAGSGMELESGKESGEAGSGKEPAAQKELGSGKEPAAQPRLRLSCKRALQYGHFLRQRYDAILVGAGTLRLDNPRLNVRVPFPPRRTPRRVVLADAAALRVKLRVFETDPHTVIVVVPDTEAERSAALLPSAAVLLPLPRQADGKFNVLQLLQTLYREHGIYSLLLEGGGQLWASFFAAGLVDKVHLFQTPRWQPQARGWQAEIGGEQAWALRDVRLLPLDTDWVVEGRVVKCSA